MKEGKQMKEILVLLNRFGSSDHCLDKVFTASLEHPKTFTSVTYQAESVTVIPCASVRKGAAGFQRTLGHSGDELVFVQDTRTGAHPR